MPHRASVLMPSHDPTSCAVELNSLRAGELDSLALSCGSSLYALCVSFHDDKMGTSIRIPISRVFKLDRVCQVLRKVSGLGAQVHMVHGKYHIRQAVINRALCFQDCLLTMVGRVSIVS